MADYTKLYRAIWRDRDFLALPSSVQRTYMMLATQPNINSAGVLTLAAARWATYAPDTTPASIAADIEVLEAARYVVVDRSTDELMVRTLIVHDELYKQRNGPRSIEIAMSEVLSDTIADCIVDVAARVGVTLTPRVKQGDPCPAVTPEPRVDPLSRPRPVPHPVPDPLSADESAAITKPSRFDEFWAPYPRKEGKGAAENQYKRAVKAVGHDTIMAGLERALPALRANHADGFCVQPARWLSEKRWNDEPCGPRRPAGTTAGARSSARSRLSELDAQARQDQYGDPLWGAIEAVGK